MDEIRTLSPEDLPGLLGLSAAAGWNQTEEDWRRLMRLEPAGCFCIALGPAIVATATAVCYGEELAWIGMVLTHPEHRGRGFGTRITARAVEHARTCGARTVGLDATDVGRPVYLRLGFVDAGPIERWSAAAPGERKVEGGRPYPEPTGPEGIDGTLDHAAFGADRRALLRELPREGTLVLPGAGFVASRPGARALQMGPCVARDEETARALIGACLGRHPTGAVYWDLLPANRGAARIAGELGFAPARRLTRMVLGRDGALRGNDALVFATAGFEYG